MDREVEMGSNHELHPVLGTRPSDHLNVRQKVQKHPELQCSFYLSVVCSGTAPDDKHWLIRSYKSLQADTGQWRSFTGMWTHGAAITTSRFTWSGTRSKAASAYCATSPSFPRRAWTAASYRLNFRTTQSKLQYTQYTSCAATVWHQLWRVFRQQHKQRSWSTKERAVPSQESSFIMVSWHWVQHSNIFLGLTNLLWSSWSNNFHMMQFAAHPGQHSPELDNAHSVEISKLQRK